MLSAHTNQDCKRSESTLELALIELDKACCTVIACLSYHQSKGTAEGAKHCQHKAPCSAAAGCHRARFGTSPTDMSGGGHLQQEAEDFSFFIFTADTLLKDNR